MIDVTLTFNSYDFSPLLSTFQVSHKVEVAESVTTMDGEEHVATRRRAVIEFALLPMSEDTIEEVYEALSVINGEATYTDPLTGEVSIVPVRVASDINSVFALKSVNGKRYYKGSTISLRQRTVI